MSYFKTKRPTFKYDIMDAIHTHGPMTYLQVAKYVPHATLAQISLSVENMRASGELVIVKPAYYVKGMRGRMPATYGLPQHTPRHETLDNVLRTWHPAHGAQT